VTATPSAASGGGWQAALAERGTLADAPAWCRAVVRVGILTYVGTLIVAVVNGSFFLLGAVIEVPIWALVTVPLARRIARAERDPGVVGFVMAAFTAKMLGVLVRQAVANGLYGGVSDAAGYDKAGRQLAPFYRRFDFSPNTGKLVGTGFIKALTGVVYAFTGTSELGAFVFFSFLSFLGLLMLWRAFRRALPEGDGRRYGLLVLFLPSLLYWPSALGKEGWALMCVGLASYGVALLLTRAIPQGVVVLAAGLVGVTMLRPHVSLVVFGGLVMAAILGKPRISTPATPLIRVATFGALFVIGSIIISQANSFLGTSNLDQNTVSKKLDKTSHQTAKDAGSRFTPVKINNPVVAPWAAVTVLFRPLPWEAHSGQELANTAESCFLIYLAYKSRRRLKSIFRYARNSPYVAYCLGFLAMFVYAFSSFANFGILARQRTQCMPLVLVFLCLPEFVPAWKKQWTSEPGAVGASTGGAVAETTHTTQTAPGEANNPYARFMHVAGTSSAHPSPEAPDDDPYARFGTATYNPYARFMDAAREPSNPSPPPDAASRDGTNDDH
jgi:hypothetical protein